MGNGVGPPAGRDNVEIVLKHRGRRWSQLVSDLPLGLEYWSDVVCRCLKSRCLKSRCLNQYTQFMAKALKPNPKASHSPQSVLADWRLSQRTGGRSLAITSGR